jgi:hypothetical protein
MERIALGAHNLTVSSEWGRLTGPDEIYGRVFGKTLNIWICPRSSTSTEKPSSRSIHAPAGRQFMRIGSFVVLALEAKWLDSLRNPDYGENASSNANELFIQGFLSRQKGRQYWDSAIWAEHRTTRRPRTIHQRHDLLHGRRMVFDNFIPLVTGNPNVVSVVGYNST